MDNRKVGLAVKRMSFAYPKSPPLLKDITFNLAPYEITALLGANGCGKTTLFRVITGGYRPEAGATLLDGEDIRLIKPRDFAKRVAVVHQYNTAPDDFTVRRLVCMGRTPYRGLFAYGESAKDREAVARALEVTETAEFEDRPIAQLSGGQRQRVWLAMALAQEPDILLLDEITTHLDIRYQYEILSLIQRLNKKEHLTILMVLHDINQALEFTDRVIVMKDGRITAQGSTVEVITEKMLEDTYQISARVMNIEDQRICLFSRFERSDK